VFETDEMLQIATTLRATNTNIKTALSKAWRAGDLHGVLAHYLATDAVARVFAAAPGVEINTDDRNIVEFGLARSVGRSAPGLVAEVRDLARATNAWRPPLGSDAGISWPAVDTAWANFVEWDAKSGGLRPDTPEEGQRQEALRRYTRLRATEFAE
jgi:hypothetical protein